MAQQGDGDRNPGDAGFDDPKTEVAYYVDHLDHMFRSAFVQEYAHVMQELMQDAIESDVECKGCGVTPVDLNDCRFIAKNGLCRECMGLD
jgi:hypothetical protein